MRWIMPILVVTVMVVGCNPKWRDPGELCLNVDCGDHGACYDGTCTCTDGYTGNSCENPPDPCIGVDCGDYGTCSDGTCTCIDGYTGDLCEIPPVDPCNPDPCADEHRVCVADSGSFSCEDCLAGYHEDGSDCVADTDCQLNTCSGHGTCDDSSGSPVCTCDLEYSGDHCDACADGFHWNADGTVCTSDPCDPNPCDELHKGTCTAEGDQAVCSCDNGYHDDGQGTCVIDETCNGRATCNDHGDCDDSSGSIVCTCDTGYTGTTCDQCDAGHHPVGNDCVEDEVCLADSCNMHGTCSTPSGVIECSCDTGWAGALCDECAPDYVGDDCHRDWCADNDCGDHGDCMNEVCECDTGYAGIICDTCDTGYHDEGGVCVLDSPPLGAEVIPDQIAFGPLQNGENNAIHVQINPFEDVSVSRHNYTFDFSGNITVDDVMYYRSGPDPNPEVDMTWNSTQLTVNFITPELHQAGVPQAYYFIITVSGVVGDTLTTALVNVRLEDGTDVPISGADFPLP